MIGFIQNELRKEESAEIIALQENLWLSIIFYCNTLLRETSGLFYKTKNMICK